MPFCTNCGQPVQPANKFCAACGTQLQTAVPAATAPPSQTPPAPPAAPPVYQNIPPAVMDEKIKFVFPNLRVPKSFGRSEEYTLVMTDRRSIFAKITQQIMNETVREARANAAAEGKGFFGKWGAQMKGFYNYAARYYKIPVEQILQETPGNFSIDNSSIRRIRITNDTNEESPNMEFGILFETTNGNHNFKTAYNQEHNFKQAYGETIVK